MLLRMRRLAVMAVAVALVIAAEALATVSAAPPHARQTRHRMVVAVHTARPPYEGEPELSGDSTAPPAPWTAAVRFVRDYEAWETGSVQNMPSWDATLRVVRLLDRAGRNSVGATAYPAPSVRVSAAGQNRYVVTSAIGNFLIGQRGSRWLAVSLPGD